MSDFTLADLERIVAKRASASAEESWTAKLVAAGQPNAAKKLGEEAVETVIAAIEGGQSTWDTSTEKLLTFARWAASTAKAFAGAVVSKPTAKNTTCLSGWAWAIRSASNGE